jgi:hypothetical protein
MSTPRGCRATRCPSDCTAKSMDRRSTGARASQQVRLLNRTASRARAGLPLAPPRMSSDIKNSHSPMESAWLSPVTICRKRHSVTSRTHGVAQSCRRHASIKTARSLVPTMSVKWCVDTNRP